MLLLSQVEKYFLLRICLIGPCNIPILGKGLFRIYEYRGLADNFPTISNNRYQVFIIATGTDSIEWDDRDPQGYTQTENS